MTCKRCLEAEFLLEQRRFSSALLTVPGQECTTESRSRHTQNTSAWDPQTWQSGPGTVGPLGFLLLAVKQEHGVCQNSKTASTCLRIHAYLIVQRFSQDPKSSQAWSLLICLWFICRVFQLFSDLSWKACHDSNTNISQCVGSCAPFRAAKYVTRKLLIQMKIWQNLCWSVTQGSQNLMVGHLTISLKVTLA